MNTHAVTWSILWPAFIAGLIAAIAGALLLTWTEKQFADVQEAIIGGSFLLAAPRHSFCSPAIPTAPSI